MIVIDVPNAQDSVVHTIFFDSTMLALNAGCQAPRYGGNNDVPVPVRPFTLLKLIVSFWHNGS